MSAVVITPTTGIPELAKCMESLNTQPAEHWIVIDGAEHAQKVADILKAGDYVNKKIILLPDNVGRPSIHWSGEKDLKFYGNRVYAGIPHLVNAEYTMFLDEDNWFEPQHVDSILRLMVHQDLDWSYSLRKLVDVKGNFIANDDCDSLGVFPNWKNVPFVDMNCYCFKTQSLLKVAHYNQNPSYNTDRELFRHAMAVTPYNKVGSTGLYTVNYRIKDGVKQFFKEGNEVMYRRYNGNFPWRAQ